MTNSKFTNLSIKEAVSKITSFIDSGLSIRMWEKGGNPSQVFIVALENNFLKVECKEEDTSWQDKKTLFNFTYNNVDYFAKGIVSEITGTVLTITLEDTLFKAEKRMNERLLAFPHHTVYSYFQFGEFSSEDKNVLSFNRSRESEDKVFASFMKDKQKHQKINGDVGELFGFRALDVSANGICFSANNQETKYFACLDEDQGVDFTIMFNGNAFPMKDGKVVYIVDYVNPRARAIPMHKIGIQFELNEDLRKDIDVAINQSIESRDLEKDFESFLDD